MSDVGYRVSGRRRLLCVPLSVLIVDDDPVIQLLLRVNFEMDGFEVETADDGEQGLRMVRLSKPDLVLLDVMMPKLDGFQVLEAIRSDEATRHLPVVLLSAKARDVDRQAGLDAGADAYITKPFDPMKLLAEVKVLVRRDEAIAEEGSGNGAPNFETASDQTATTGGQGSQGDPG